MQTKTPTKDEPDESTTRPYLDAPVFGVDRDGCLHRYDNGDVVVTRDGSLERLEPDVGRDDVGAWISYVGSERGWIDVWWHAEGVDTVARLTNALDAAGQGSA